MRLPTFTDLAWQKIKFPAH